MPNDKTLNKRKNKTPKEDPKMKGVENHYGVEFGSDENFAFIVGFTSGGFPYGISHEEMIEI